MIALKKVSPFRTVTYGFTDRLPTGKGGLPSGRQGKKEQKGAKPEM